MARRIRRQRQTTKQDLQAGRHLGALRLRSHIGVFQDLAQQGDRDQPIRAASLDGREHKVHQTAQTIAQTLYRCMTGKVLQGPEPLAALGVNSPPQQVQGRGWIGLEAKHDAQHLLPGPVLIQDGRTNRRIALRGQEPHQQFRQPAVSGQTRVDMGRAEQGQDGLPQIVTDGAAFGATGEYIRAQVAAIAGIEQHDGRRRAGMAAHGVTHRQR